MSLRQVERRTVGQALTPVERLVAGVIALTGGVAHALLAAAALAFLYALLLVA